MVSVTVEDHGKVIVIFIRGEFYLESVEYVEKIWNEQVAKKPATIGINCSAIKYVDSSAIGVLVKFLNNAMKEKISLVFYDLSEPVSAIFNIAKLANFFKTMTKSQFEKEYLP